MNIILRPFNGSIGHFAQEALPAFSPMMKKIVFVVAAIFAASAAIYAIFKCRKSISSTTFSTLDDLEGGNTSQMFTKEKIKSLAEEKFKNHPLKDKIIEEIDSPLENYPNDAEISELTVETGKAVYDHRRYKEDDTKAEEEVCAFFKELQIEVTEKKLQPMIIGTGMCD